MSLSEAALQQKIVMHYRNTYCRADCNPKHLIFSVPNEGKAQNFKIGLLAGVSDLVILHGSKVIFMELKTEIGVQSEKQKMFEKDVKNLGFSYYLVRSFDEYLNVIANA